MKTAEREQARKLRIKGSKTNAARALARHREAQRIGRVAARQGDVLHAAGCMLWLRELGLPKTCLRKSGTCRLNISDTRLLHEIYGAIQEYGGFDREGWLM